MHCLSANLFWHKATHALQISAYWHTYPLHAQNNTYKHRGSSIYLQRFARLAAVTLCWQARDASHVILHASYSCGRNDWLNPITFTLQSSYSSLVHVCTTSHSSSSLDYFNKARWYKKRSANKNFRFFSESWILLISPTHGGLSRSNSIFE